ncbi:Mediator of RNA polymerase II transcription subunit 32 [Dichanthelium oligosanthes]|uniref:Mediator of RNA polymerase II transcription subunit 32 n=1 Tax=Dichanthelium oligosanthes TaxID=888268 RepID=A0A1E5WAN0_9POAL|nr:Mediator of RNA polymerase II transcription subunit 32 [Dichanthelium oligosanthes]
MEQTVDELSAAYDDFVAAAAAVLEARAQSAGEKTAATDAALEAFKQRWELFRVACDHAEELVESIRQRIGSECLVDEATGSASTGSAPAPMAAAPGIKPISAVRLEQMSKAVRWLVIELQHGAGGTPAPGTAGSGGASNPNAGAGPGPGGQHPEEGGQ